MNLKGGTSSVAQPEGLPCATHNSGSGRESKALPTAVSMRIHEASLIRSVFDYHQEPWGPNVTSAIAWMAKGELEDTSLHRIVEALLELKVKLGRMPSEAAVADLIAHKLIGTHDQALKSDALIRFSGVLNGFGQCESLPMSIAESEALDMIAWYKGKSLWRLVADTEQRMRSDFYCAIKVAQELKESLYE